MSLSALILKGTIATVFAAAAAVAGGIIMADAMMMRKKNLDMKNGLFKNRPPWLKTLLHLSRLEAAPTTKVSRLEAAPRGKVSQLHAASQNQSVGVFFVGAASSRDQFIHSAVC
jgi:hypothetical protein